MKFSRSQKDRYTNTVGALLAFTNANLGSCIYFEPPIQSDKQIWEGIRIAQDLWSNTSLIDEFVAKRPKPFLNADFDLAKTWENAIPGPLVLMETHGDRALFMCERSVFEVWSVYRPWSAMNLYLPDIVMTTLIPFDGIIVTDSFLLRHDGHATGPGLQRIRQEFNDARTPGVIKGGVEFVKASQRIRNIRTTIGLNPTEYIQALEYTDYLNFMSSRTCFPFEPDLKYRSWDDVPQDFLAIED